MSRGPGHVERTIQTTFDVKPDEAYTTEDLADHVYPGVEQIEKKHRVAIIRGAKKVCERTGWNWFTTWALGGRLVFYDPCNLMSYAIGREKADMLNNYRIGDKRISSAARDPRIIRAKAERIRRDFEPGGKRHHLVAEGGPWWRHVQIAIADRDGDATERAQALRAEQEAIVTAYRRKG